MSKLEITNIRRGKGERSHIIYANLYKITVINLSDGPTEHRELEISATLDYIVEQLKSGRFFSRDKEEQETD